MISVFHLLWIVPTAAGAEMLVLAIFVGIR